MEVGVARCITLMVFIQRKLFTKSEKDPLLEWCLKAVVYINEKRLHLELKSTQCQPMHQAGVN